MNLATTLLRKILAVINSMKIQRTTGRFGYDFYADRIYFQPGDPTKWEDVTEEFREAMLDYLSQYRELPTEGWIVYRTKVKDKTYRISIKREL